MLCFKLFLLSGVYVLVHGNKIDIDYYGHDVTRHTRVEMNCELELHKQYCRFKCSRDHPVCIEGNCYCLQGDSAGLLPLKQFNKPEDLPSEASSEETLSQHNHPLSLNSEPLNLNSEPLNLNSEPLNPNSEPHDSVSHPALRHHIAHFCPNLDEARKCIRICMPQGKPAFCGKDHVCYCGHIIDSQNPVKTRPGDAKAIYAQFKDLYEKYFGKQPENAKGGGNQGTIVEPDS